MSNDPYPHETLNGDEDDGTMPENVATLAENVIGHRIVKVEQDTSATVIVLDDGRRVSLADTSDCCAYTELEEFWLDPSSVDHMILGVGTTGDYTTWHIYADFGDVMRLKVGWSCGNPFYYGYGFAIAVAE